MERHEAIQTFMEPFSVAVLALEAIAEAAVKASPKVHQLLACILTPSLTVRIDTVAKRQLQAASSDLVIILKLIDHVRLW